MTGRMCVLPPILLLNSQMATSQLILSPKAIKFGIVSVSRNFILWTKDILPLFAMNSEPFSLPSL